MEKHSRGAAPKPDDSARLFTSTFSGIRPVDAPGFVAMQLIGAAAATALFRWLLRKADDRMKKSVLILCTGNSARSQMAEGLLRYDAGDRFEVASAGMHPSKVRPEAIAVMQEIGIDISGHWPKSVDEFVDRPFDFVVTVCDHANEAWPFFPGPALRIHQKLRRPGGF